MRFLNICFVFPCLLCLIVQNDFILLWILMLNVNQFKLNSIKSFMCDDTQNTNAERNNQSILIHITQLSSLKIFAYLFEYFEHCWGLLRFLYTDATELRNLCHQEPVSLRLMMSQFKDIITNTQKYRTV